VNFLIAATRDTHEIAEVDFADARMLMFAVLTVFVVAACVWKRLSSGKVTFGSSLTGVTAAFLWFFQ